MPGDTVDDASAELIVKSDPATTQGGRRLQSTDCTGTWCPGLLERDDEEACQVRQAILEGKGVRCGYDEQSQTCQLWVGANLVMEQGVAGKHATNADCPCKLESVNECTPDATDACAGVGRDIADARAACTSLVDNAGLFSECAFAPNHGQPRSRG